jgi:hypothetical protein
MQNDDLSFLGGSPILPLGDLNLAGSYGFPDPDELFAACLSTQLIQPDYDSPCLDQPQLHGGDPAYSPLSYLDEFASDPLLPDLTAVPRPFAVDLLGYDIPDYTASEDLSLEDQPGLGFSNLKLTHNPVSPDPLLPDLQQPDLQPEVVMPADERPGDLAPDALDVMHQTAQYQRLAGKHYPEVYLDQRGVNDRRSREFTLLMKGLDAEEQGKEL